MRNINADQLEQIGKGVTAGVYALDEDRIVKIFRDVVPIEEIRYEYDCARLVAGMGIHTPRALEIVSTDEGTGIIYERIKGITLSEVMQENKTDLFQLGERYGCIVKSLHQQTVEGIRLPRVREKMKRVIEAGADFLTAGDIEEYTGYIELVPERERLLHGDIAPVNIMVEEGQMYIIDVPMVMVGNPLFDLLQPYSFCVQTRCLYELYLEMPEEEKNSPVGRYLARFKTRYLNEEQSRRVWDGFFMGYFGEMEDEKRKNLEYTLQFYYSIRQVGAVMMRRKFGDETVRFLVKRGKSWINENKKDMKRLDFSLFE